MMYLRTAGVLQEQGWRRQPSCCQPVHSAAAFGKFCKLVRHLLNSREGISEDCSIAKVGLLRHALPVKDQQGVTLVFVGAENER